MASSKFTLKNIGLMRSVNTCTALQKRDGKNHKHVFLFLFCVKIYLVKYDTEVIVPLYDIKFSAVDAELFCLQVVGSRMERPVLQKQVSTF